MQSQPSPNCAPSTHTPHTKGAVFLCLNFPRAGQASRNLSYSLDLELPEIIQTSQSRAVSPAQRGLSLRNPSEGSRPGSPLPLSCILTTLVFFHVAPHRTA